jgi:hypothetical protein
VYRLWTTFIDVSLLQALRKPLLGLASVTLGAQFQHLRDNFGALPKDYLDFLYKKLNQLQDRTPFLSVTHRIVLYSEMCTAAGVPLYPLDKISLLKTCFAFGKYQRAITRWIRKHPQTLPVPPQAGDQSYKNLLAVLTQESQLMVFTTLPPQHALHALRDDATGSALAITTTKTTKPPATPAVPNAKSPRRDHYCWVHGHSGHTSPDCKYPLPGHQANATKANPMGGATYQWTKLSAVKRAQAMKDGPVGISA